MKKLALTILFLSGAAHAETVTQPYGATSTQTSGTVTTASTFVSALAADSGRRGCMIFNNNATDYLLVFFGATASATIAKSIKVLAGAAISCLSGGIILQDNVAVTSGANGSTYVVVSQ